MMMDNEEFMLQYMETSAASGSEGNQQTGFFDKGFSDLLLQQQYQTQQSSPTSTLGGPVFSNFPSPTLSNDSNRSSPTSANPTVNLLDAQQFLQSLSHFPPEGFDQFVQFDHDNASFRADQQQGQDPEGADEDLLVVEDENEEEEGIDIIDLKEKIPAKKKNISKAQKANKPPRQLECFNCHVTKTPLWRRTPDRAHSLCNACGLYYKQYNTHRPLHIRQKHQSNQSKQTAATTTTTSVNNTAPSSPTPVTAPASDEETLTYPSPRNFQDLSPAPQEETRCHQCYQTNATSWHLNSLGQTMCGACAIYASMQQPTSNSGSSSPVVGQKRRSCDAILIEEDNVQETHKMQRLYQQPQVFPSMVMPNASIQMDCLPTSPIAPQQPPQQQQQQQNQQDVRQQNDDTRFKLLIGRMSPQQMEGFLNMLERRCAILRSIIYSDNNNNSIIIS
ncbi:hypothetical protein [Parasitella parasitica]|uniref:GATA-type domain-containing protein n=1 Tax=Parasitella parasitica TaxID=35722 RepID=A0A0B7N2T8_9FUNG|nr:hypothetical protein [Parasitella parasitica]